jgi:topoisomerase-4 subunit A
MEKWEPKKPITAIHWAGEKELFYVKRFLIDTPEKLDNVLTDNSKSYLETVFTDHRPVAELVFTKERGKERKDNLVIDLENFISLKGIGALGNQLTKYKVLEINPLDPLPFELPEVTPAAAIEVVDQQAVNAVDLVETSVTSQEDVSKDESSSEDKEPPIGDDGQALLF